MFEDLDILKFTNFFKNYLLDVGLTIFWADTINMFITLLVITVIAYFFDRFLRFVIVKLFYLFSIKTKTTFDDFLVTSKFPRYVAHIIPLFILKYIVPSILLGFPFLLKAFETVINIYGIILIVKIIRSFIKSTQRYLRTKERFKDKPLESYLQVLMMFTWGTGIFFIINLMVLT